ncbi:type II secretion system F family protein [Geomicrobium sp. JCM 19039]|uniref:type II secretion system F family protein n=1 Tax=Geomicrobium sp. JCM 19039 TaxID=1460636 RepID=UPI00045F40D4|nr:type II secretion system F family protein [Geomicrobium sp. JCM 19039]GAK12762.1 late competence protein ComGB, access of DNA to ComEA [Geomicrobium sp. JCM 19039]
MKRKWPQAKKAKFFLNLGRLLRRGYTLNHGAKLLSYNGGDIAKARTDEWLVSLEEGKPWQEAIKALQVPSDIEAYLHFSERYGMIANGFYFAGRMLHEREQVKTIIRSVLRYPILLLWVIMLLFFVMTFFVFPQFESLFSTMNIDYPLITTFTFALFQSIPYILLVFVFIFLLGFVAYQLWFKSKTAIEKFHYFSRVPFVSTLLRIYVTYSISLQFGHLLRGGLVAHDVLRVFISHEKRSLFSEEGKRLNSCLIVELHLMKRF